MTTRVEFEILDHGCDGEQYFPGCGAAFSCFTDVATGIGVSAREALEDAVEQMACSLPSWTDKHEAVEFPVAAIAAAALDYSDAESFDPTDPEISDEWHHYVSIRWRVVEA